MVTVITGVLCTMVTDIMEAHANILPIELLMHRVCYRATIRLTMVPDSHPLHKPMLTCACRPMKSHLSPIHTLLPVYNIKPADYEIFSSASWPPNSTCKLTTNIVSSRDESKEADLVDDTALKIYTDGSGQDGMASATAILFEGGKAMKVLCYQLGLLEHHMTYEAELVGILWGVWITQKTLDVSAVSIKADSQAAIQTLHAHKKGPGSYLLDEI